VLIVGKKPMVVLRSALLEGAKISDLPQRGY
jgi:hypothetical protein